jgi:hypothetical protein
MRDGARFVQQCVCQLMAASSPRNWHEPSIGHPRGRGSPPARRNRRRKLRVDASTMDALYLGAAVIKLVLSDSVVANMKREAFVLRSGLAAAARAISSVPAASIATSVANDMLPGGRHERGAALSSLSSSSPSSASLQVSNEFVSLLFKAKTMFEGMAKDDRADKTVKALSQGGLNYIQLLIIDALEEHARSEQLEDALQRTEVIVALDPDAGDAGGGTPGPSRIRIPSQTNTILL